MDVDRNGCDTRNDILARDLTDETFKPGTRDCVVATGTLADPTPGRRSPSSAGRTPATTCRSTTSSLSPTPGRRAPRPWTRHAGAAFANDPLNLLAVDGPLNQQKSDGDAATWLPPNRSYRCAYVARQVAVKVRYDLWTTRAERNAIATILRGCPDEPLPGGVGGAASPAPASAPAPSPAPAPSAPFENCAAARAAGAAPVHRGEPGYGAHLDGNDDGVGCES